MCKLKSRPHRRTRVPIQYEPGLFLFSYDSYIILYVSFLLYINPLLHSKHNASLFTLVLRHDISKNENIIYNSFYTRLFSYICRGKKVTPTGPLADGKMIRDLGAIPPTGLKRRLTLLKLIRIFCHEKTFSDPSSLLIDPSGRCRIIYIHPRRASSLHICQ